MATDRRFLERHGQQWRVQVKVPEKVRPIIGRSRLVRSLGTDSLALANARRWDVVAEFKKQIRDAEDELSRRASLGDPLMQEAIEWRSQYETARQRTKGEVYDENGVRDFDEVGLAQSLIDDRTDEIALRHGANRAATFHGVATGLSTPIPLLIDAWLAEAQMKPRQKTDYRRAVIKLDGWLAAGDRSTAVEQIDRKCAGQYVADTFVAKGVNPKTANKDVSCLSSFWRWLEKRGHVHENVWKNQAVAKRRVPKAEGKRPYRDEEITTLIEGGAPTYLKDAIILAALSGMRIEEIARMKVGHIAGDCFEIREAKTAAGERVVPIHPELRELVDRRSAGKSDGDYLFHELPTPKMGSPVERSQKISKAFTAYRRKLGVDEVVMGARQSRVDFHSFRRWFIRKASEALLIGQPGFSAWTLAEVVGHSKEDMALGLTMGRYPGDSSMVAKRACIDAISLPSPNARPSE